MPEFKINEYITLKLEGNETIIFINGEEFMQCKYLMLNIPNDNAKDVKEIASIDEAAELLSWTEYVQSDIQKYNIPPEIEFFGHCSNLQAWHENNYDTRLLQSNLAFPLLKKLAEMGDPLAKKRFKEEIVHRIESGYPPVIEFLIKNDYLEEFSKEELNSIHIDYSAFLRERFRSYYEKEDLGEFEALIHLYFKDVFNTQVILPILEELDDYMYRDLIYSDIIDYIEVKDLLTSEKAEDILLMFLIIEERLSRYDKGIPRTFHEKLGSIDLNVSQIILKLIKRDFKNKDLEKGAIYLEYDYLDYLNKEELKELWDYMKPEFLNFWIKVNEIRAKHHCPIEGETLFSMKVNKFTLEFIRELLPQPEAEFLKDFCKIVKDELFIIDEFDYSHFQFIIFKNNHITTLVYTHASLTSLPESIGNLTHLEYLELYDNKLEYLPDSIGNLTALKEFYLYRNNLEKLPESLGKLENLEYLTILENKITELPESIKELKNLKKLDFHDHGPLTFRIR